MFVFWETQEPWENPERKKERGMNCLLIPTDSSSIWEPNPAVRLHFENPSHYIFSFIHLKFIFSIINDRIAAS